MSLRQLFQVSVFVLAPGAVFAFQTAPCAEGWDPNFAPASYASVPDGPVYSSVIFDDGSGPKLYIGGDFGRIGSTLARGIARWDGESWSAVGTMWSTNGGGAGIAHVVRALAVYDDGSGPALYAGGRFSTAQLPNPITRIARWDGLNWSVPGGGVNGEVNALVAHDDGSGPKLYAGGAFTTAGGQPALRIASWNGVAWSSVGTGIDGTVKCLASYGAGAVRHLYAGGQFATAGGASAEDIARWDGAVWSALGAGPSVSDGVLSLHVFDDGSGSKLAVGGYYSKLAGVSANSIASFDGSTLSTLGTGFNGDVRALATWNDGNGPALIAGGFLAPPSGGAFGLNRWDGATWTGIGGGVSDAAVQMMRAHDDGHGTRLYVGGEFTSTGGGVGPGNLATWDTTTWNAVGTPYAANGIGGHVFALETHDDGSGRALYAGGYFGQAGGQPANQVARWNGTQWSPLGSGLNGFCDALLSYDLGTGSLLYAAGTFTSAGGQPATAFASWNGTNWTPVPGLSGGVTRIRALQGWDDGFGPAVFIAGSFVTSIGPAMFNIGRWNGTSWSTLDDGIGGFGGDVRSLAVFDDGTGPALYAGGRFDSADLITVNNIARWNGTTWSAVGNGVGATGGGNAVHALCVFDDGTGPALYAGGDFVQASGVTARCLARWNGTTWSAVPGELLPATVVYSLRVVDDGTGPALSVGGRFATAGGVPASSLARWNGTNWSNVGVGLGLGGGHFTLVAGGIGDITQPVVYAQEFFDDGSGGGADLYVGGAFISAGGYLSNDLARFNTCAEPFTNFCAGDGSASACPCANSGAVGHGCATSTNANGSLLVASGTPSIGADLVVLSASELPEAFATIVQGTQPAGGGLGIQFGDGLFCVAGSLVRVATRFAPGGNLQYPLVGDAPLSVGGGVPYYGGARTYQVWYRDAFSFCTPATFNLSNGVRFTWTL